MNPATLLNSLPSGLRDPLIAALNEVCRNYAERRWEPSELNGGKLVEIVYTIIDGALDGKFVSKPTKPKNVVDACRALEKYPEDKTRVGDRSLRILIPRMLVALYEIRSNRGVGHAGGDVDPNFMDATVVHTMSRWIVGDIIRVFHNVSIADAQNAVDLLIERKLPIIWEIESTRRVLPSVNTPDEVLLLLYAEASWVSVASLLEWTEYRNASDFRTKVLTTLHTKRLVEYERDNGRAHITSAGIKFVEAQIFPKVGTDFI
jgi:hypothetical protein